MKLTTFPTSAKKEKRIFWSDRINEILIEDRGLAKKTFGDSEAMEREIEFSRAHTEALPFFASKIKLYFLPIGLPKEENSLIVEIPENAKLLKEAEEDYPEIIEILEREGAKELIDDLAVEKREDGSSFFILLSLRNINLLPL